MSIHQRSLSTHSNRDLITKFSSLNHTLNTQTTPRAKPSHRLPEKMNSTSMLLQRFRSNREDSELSISFQAQDQTVRKNVQQFAQPENQYQNSTLKKTNAKTQKSSPAPYIQKDQAEAIDRLLSYNKVKEKRLTQLIAVQTQKELETQQKVVLSKNTQNIAAKLIQKQIESIPQQDPLWSILQHRDKQIQVDFGDERPLRDVIKQFKTNKSKQNKINKKLVHNQIDHQGFEAKETQTSKSFLQKQSQNTKSNVITHQSQMQIQRSEDGELEQSQEDGEKSIINTHSSQQVSNYQTEQSNQQENRVTKPDKNKGHMNESRHSILPIHERIKIDQRRKQQWIQKQQESAKQIEDLTIKHHTRKETSESEVLKDFLSNQDRWVTKRNEFVQRQRVQKNEDGLEGLTFMPKLNEKSIQVFKYINIFKLAKKNKTKKTTEDRLNEYQETKKQKIELLQELQVPVFHPIISPLSKLVYSKF